MFTLLRVIYQMMDLQPMFFCTLKIFYYYGLTSMPSPNNQLNSIQVLSPVNQRTLRQCGLQESWKILMDRKPHHLIRHQAHPSLSMLNIYFHLHFHLNFHLLPYLQQCNNPQLHLHLHLHLNLHLHLHLNFLSHLWQCNNTNPKL